MPLISLFFFINNSTNQYIQLGSRLALIGFYMNGSNFLQNNDAFTARVDFPCEGLAWLGHTVGAILAV